MGCARPDSPSGRTTTQTVSSRRRSFRPPGTLGRSATAWHLGEQLDDSSRVLPNHLSVLTLWPTADGSASLPFPSSTRSIKSQRRKGMTRTCKTWRPRLCGHPDKTGRLLRERTLRCLFRPVGAPCFRRSSGSASAIPKQLRASGSAIKMRCVSLVAPRPSSDVGEGEKLRHERGTAAAGRVIGCCGILVVLEQVLQVSQTLSRSKTASDNAGR